MPVSRLPPAEGADAPAKQPQGGLAVGQWQNLNLLNDAEALLAWKNLVGPRWQERKPKLVIVTVSGGGILLRRVAPAAHGRGACRRPGVIR